MQFLRRLFVIFPFACVLYIDFSAEKNRSKDLSRIVSKPEIHSTYWDLNIWITRVKDRIEFRSVTLWAVLYNCMEVSSAEVRNMEQKTAFWKSEAENLVMFMKERKEKNRTAKIKENPAKLPKTNLILQ
jgi:hypothetical protein